MKLYQITLFLILCLINNFTLAKEITATNWLVADGNGRIIDGEKTNEVRSIASITKLITVMTVIDAHQDLNEKINQFTRRQLIKLSLVKSDNTAARQLCEYYPGGLHKCVAAMNNKVKALGLDQTKFIEPTGLSVFNTSTAEDLMTIIIEAQNYKLITEDSNTSQDKIRVKKHWYTFHNTNPLVADKNFIITKTGYIRASGGCVVMMLDTSIGRRIIVLLNSKDTRTRFKEAELLVSKY
jgi:D-alanyl-D-alanine endopeptidase (penicillin-binding protein 7)